MSKSKNNLLGIAYIYEKNRFRIARISILSPFLDEIILTHQEWYRKMDELFLFDIIASISNYDISEFSRCHLIQVEFIYTRNARKFWNVFFVNRNFYFEEIFGSKKPTGEINFKKIPVDQLNIITKLVMKHLSKDSENNNSPTEFLPRYYEKSEYIYEINTSPSMKQNRNNKPLSSLIGIITFMNTPILIRNFVFSSENTISFQINEKDSKLLNEVHGSSDLISFSLYFPTKIEGTQQILEQKLMGDLLLLQKINANECEAVIRYIES